MSIWTRRFYGMAKAMDVTRIIVDGARACAQTRYELEPPGGRSFESHVAEVLEVSGGRITAPGIYFDSAPLRSLRLLWSTRPAGGSVAGSVRMPGNRTVRKVAARDDRSYILTIDRPI